MAERRNWTMVETAREMLEEKTMPRINWAEAIQMVIYIQNRISTPGAKMSPHELYFGCKRNVRHVRVFNSIEYVHVPNEKKRKLDAKVELLA